MSKDLKKPIVYKFHCKICGTEFRPLKKHAMTCSTTCRVALSNIMRYSEDPIDPNETPLTDEDKKLIDEKIAKAKGEGIENPITRLGRAGQK